MNVTDGLETLRADTADAVREAVRAESMVWALVPSLALESDGRTGYSGLLSTAYRDGLWTVTGVQAHGAYLLWVDCATGELTHGDEHLRPASDALVIRALERPQELDAIKVVADLTLSAKAKTGSYYDEAEQDAWRAGIREELGLTGFYTRERKPREKVWSMD